MSAFICNPEHLGILAAYAAHHDAVIHSFRRKDRAETAKNIARALARENIRSVAHAYPDGKDGDRPGPRLFDDDIEEAAALYGEHYFRNGAAKRLNPVQILKFCQCYVYQSCETDDWRDTVAWSQLDWMIGHAIQALPGYDGFKWEASDEESPPGVEELYAKHRG